MRTIYLIRHGMPDFPGGTPVCLGRMELPLCREGLIQAALLREYFRDKPVSAVFCSPRQRTVQTARAISENCVAVDDLREMDVGDWEGLTFAEIREKYPELYRQRGIDPFAMQIPNAEHMRAFRERVLTAFHKLLDTVSGDIVIAAHAGVNRVILCETLGLVWEKLYSIKQTYGGMSILQQDENGLFVREALLLPKPPLSDALCADMRQILGTAEAFAAWKTNYALSAEQPKPETQASALWQWTPDMVRFMDDAARFGSYDRSLADCMLPYMDAGDTVCDAGCGLAYLGMTLAPHVKSVTALDINSNALAAASENCAARGIANLEILCTDANALPDSLAFDDMIFCLYGEIGEILRIAARHCRKQVFIVKRNYTSHRFSVGRHPLTQDNYESTCAYLDSKGIPYENRTLSLEHGQPFRCMEDARRFFSLYSKDSEPSQVTDVFLADRLTETGNEEFPYYLPQRKELGLIRLDAASIPKNE